MIARTLLVGALCLITPRATAQAGHEADAPATDAKKGSESASPAYPDTIAGRRAKAFIDAFNSNDADTIRAFERLHRAASRLSESDVERRVTQLRDLYADWGTIKVLDLDSRGEQELTIVAEASNARIGLEMAFELEKNEPHRLEAVRIAVARHGPATISTDATLEPDEIREAVETIAATLEADYVYPKVGASMAEVLRKSLAKDEYGKIDRADTLAARLTAQLQAICHDRHLRVRAGSSRPEGEEGSETQWWERTRWENYGFVRAERLPGNIGYLRLDQFHPGDEAKQVAAAAMNFLAHTDALIFDLRENGGGSPVMIAFLSGYLFDEPVHLNSFYNRPTDSTSETWSDKDVPGIVYGQSKPVYVLTSGYTLSGAEEFSYNLKHLKRGTIVGETTGGGAHPVERRQLTNQLWMTVPFARAINPVTGTNWEGVGVKPDVTVAAADALMTAQRLALESLLASASPGPKKQAVQSALRALGGSVQAVQHP